MPCRASCGQQREGQVFAHRHIRDDAVGLAVLGAEADPGANRICGRPELDRLRPRRATSPASSAIRAEDGPGGLACGPSRAGRRGRRSRRRARSRRPRCEPAAPAQSPARRATADRPGGLLRRSRWRPVRRTSASSRPSIAGDELQLVISAIGLIVHGAAVAHDRHAVADRVELVEPVADEDDRRRHRACSWRMTSNSVATSRSSSEEVGSSMITSLASHRHRPGDRDHLLQAAMSASAAAGVTSTSDAEAVQQRRAPRRASAPPVEQPAAARLAPEEDVLG